MSGITEDDLDDPEPIRVDEVGEFRHMYNVVHGFRDGDGICYVGIRTNIETLHDHGFVPPTLAKKIASFPKLEALHVASRIEEMDAGEMYMSGNRIFKRLEIPGNESNAVVIYKSPEYGEVSSFYIHSEQIREIASLPLPEK